MKKKLTAGFLTAALLFSSMSFAVSAEGRYNAIIPEEDIRAHAIISELGDWNGDGLVTAADALMLLRYAVGLESALPFSIPSQFTGNEDPAFYVDLDGNGAVTVADALTALRCSIGLNTAADVYNVLEASEFSCDYSYPEGRDSDCINFFYTPSPTVFSSADDSSTENFVPLPEKYDEAFFAEYDLIRFQTFSNTCAVPMVGQVAYTDGYVYLRCWDWNLLDSVDDAHYLWVYVAVPKGFADGKKITVTRADPAMPLPAADDLFYLESEYVDEGVLLFCANSRKSLYGVAKELNAKNMMNSAFAEWLNLRDTEEYFANYTTVLYFGASPCPHARDCIISSIDVTGGVLDGGGSEEQVATIRLHYTGTNHIDPDGKQIMDLHAAIAAYCLDIPNEMLKGCTNIKVVMD